MGKFIFGVGVGFLGGILLAPKTGAQTRKMISKKAGKSVKASYVYDASSGVKLLGTSAFYVRGREGELTAFMLRSDAQIDVAALICGADFGPRLLTPLPIAALPGWDTEQMGERLFEDTEQAAEVPFRHINHDAIGDQTERADEIPDRSSSHTEPHSGVSARFQCRRKD